MRIRQRAQFIITSETVTPDAITARLLIEPDESRPRGSRVPERDLPRVHIWALHVGNANRRVDDQIEELYERVSGSAKQIRSLVNDGCTARFLVGRHFDDPDGEEEHHEPVLLPDGREITIVSGQHQLLGWGLEDPILTFMASAGVILDVDEYG